MVTLAGVDREYVSDLGTTSTTGSDDVTGSESEPLSGKDMQAEFGDAPKEEATVSTSGTGTDDSGDRINRTKTARSKSGNRDGGSDTDTKTVNEPDGADRSDGSGGSEDPQEGATDEGGIMLLDRGGGSSHSPPQPGESGGFGMKNALVLGAVGLGGALLIGSMGG